LLRIRTFETFATYVRGNNSVLKLFLFSEHFFVFRFLELIIFAINTGLSLYYFMRATGDWKCRTWKWRTPKILRGVKMQASPENSGSENAVLENDIPENDW